MVTNKLKLHNSELSGSAQKSFSFFKNLYIICRRLEMMGLWTHHMKACGFGNLRRHFICHMWFIGLGFNGGRDYWRNRREYFSYFTCFMGHLKFGHRFIYYVRSLATWLDHCSIPPPLSKKLIIAFNWSLIKLDSFFFFGLIGFYLFTFE